MPQIVKDFQGQTVITTFETTPAMAFDLVEALEVAYRDCISRQTAPDFDSPQSVGTLARS